MKQALAWAVAGGVTLAACGGSSPGGGGSWKATDACATLDKAKVAAAAGTSVTSAELGGVNEGTGGLASLSTCTYALGNGGSIGVLIRVSPDDNDPPADYQKSSEAMGMKLDPVGGVGQSAFWATGMNSLQVFVDKRRYTAINYTKPPKDADAKAVLTRIAHDLGA